MSNDKYFDMLDLSFKTGRAICFKGVHGIGKTEIIKSWADKRGLNLVVMHLANYEGADLTGIPFIQEKSGRTVTNFAAPVFFSNIMEAADRGQHSVLFLDEFNRASDPSVKQSALELVLNRKVATHSLPVIDGVKTMVIVAINPSDGYQVEDLDPAVINRMTTIEMRANTKSWLSWANKSNINKMVIEYIGANEKSLYLFDPKNNKHDGVYATPRSWHAISDYLNSGLLKLSESSYMEIMRGEIGTEASPFNKFIMDKSNLVLTTDKVIEFVDNHLKNGVKPQECSKIIADGKATLFKNTDPSQLMNIFTNIANKCLVGENEDKNSSPYLIHLLCFTGMLENEVKISCLKSIKVKTSSIYPVYQPLVDIDASLNNKDIWRSAAESVLAALRS